MSKKEQILNEAESRVRTGGYNNVSFRDLADAVGIKSASVHYHFPTKADLGVALAERYTDNFMLSLGNAKNDSNDDPFASYIDLFRHALNVDKKMCLCGLLGAELDGLPTDVRLATRRFFERNLEWLSEAHQHKYGSSKKAASTEAIKLISLLEGALLVSRSLDDASLFDQAVNALRTS